MYREKMFDSFDNFLKKFTEKNLKSRKVLRIDRKPVRRFSNVLKPFPDFKPDLQVLPYKEARRRRFHVYETTLIELNEAGCSISGGIFKCLLRKEEALASRGSISTRLSSTPNVLHQMVEWAIEGEHAASEGTEQGIITNLGMMQRMIVLLQRYKDYDWLLQIILMLAVTACEEHDQREKNMVNYACNAQKSTVYWLHAVYLSKHKSSLLLSLTYYTKALELCRGEYWTIPEWVDCQAGPTPTLHDSVAISYARALRNCVKFVESSDQEAALKFNQLAIVAISEVMKECHLGLLAETYVIRIELLLHLERYSEARSSFVKIDRELAAYSATPEISRTTWKLLRLKGILLMRFKQYDTAVSVFHEALRVVRHNNLAEAEANVLLTMGQFYAKELKDNSEGGRYLQQAAKVFADIGHREGYTKASYALGSMRAGLIKPDLLELVCKSTQKFRHLKKLRKWTESCTPFWTDTNLSDAVERSRDGNQIADLWGKLRGRPSWVDRSATDFLPPKVSISEEQSRHSLYWV